MKENRNFLEEFVFINALVFLSLTVVLETLEINGNPFRLNLRHRIALHHVEARYDSGILNQPFIIRMNVFEAFFVQDELDLGFSNPLREFDSLFFEVHK